MESEVEDGGARRVSCVDSESKQAKQLNSKIQDNSMEIQSLRILPRHRAKANEAWNQGEDYESETGSGLEVAIPDAPRPIRIQNRPRTPPRRKTAAPKGRKGASDKKDTLASILGALEDLKADNTKLKADYAELKTGNAELLASNAEIQTGAGKLMKELAEVKAQLAETNAQLADMVSMTRIDGIGFSRVDRRVFTAVVRFRPRNISQPIISS